MWLCCVPIFSCPGSVLTIRPNTPARISRSVQSLYKQPPLANPRWWSPHWRGPRQAVNTDLEALGCLIPVPQSEGGAWALSAHIQRDQGCLTSEGQRQLEGNQSVAPACTAAQAGFLLALVAGTKSSLFHFCSILWISQWFHFFGDK